MAYIKKYSELVPMITVPAATVKGEVRAILRDENLKVVRDTGWAPNIVTDTGMVNFGKVAAGNGSWYNYTHIGSSGTAPAVTDSTLGGWLAYSNVSLPFTYGPTPSAPNYEYSSIIGRRFNAGVGTGTVREIGLSNATTNQYMAIRTLLGTPIVKAADQVLDAYHRLTVYPNLNDITGQTTIEGQLYDYTLRPWRLPDTGYEAHRIFSFSTNNNNHRAHGGTIVGGTTLADPTPFDNSIYGGYSTSVAEAGNGSGYFDQLIFWDLNKSNNYTNGNWSSNGILATTHRTRHVKTAGSVGGCQIGWSRVSDGFGLNKTETKVINLTIRFTWARH